MKKANAKFVEEHIENNEKIIIGTTYKTMFGEGTVVQDFLPAPHELALKKSKTVKVTMTLDKESIEFFKTEARKLNSSYQRMIRNLLSKYASKHREDKQTLA